VVVENVDLPNCGTPLEAPIQLQVNWVDPQTGEAKVSTAHYRNNHSVTRCRQSPTPPQACVHGSIRLVKHIPERRSVAGGRGFQTALF
jgi:hypothetical protein